MTTIARNKVRCQSCEAESEQTVLTSTNSFGAPDLDLRPAPMKRDTMNYWLQQCPQCRIICPDITEPPVGAKAVVAGPQYLALARDTGIPDLCRKFRAWGFLAETLGLAQAAADAHLHAAWAADDANAPLIAKSQRLAAVALYTPVRDRKKVDPEQPGSAEILLADLWRRSENWGNAVREAKQGLNVATEDCIRELCAYEIRLAESNDAACHTVDQAKSA
jgi:hypothetical protein